MSSIIDIRPIDDAIREEIRSFVIQQWMTDIVVVHSTVYHPHQAAGFVARDGDRIIGLITYVDSENGREIITLDSLQESQGIGSALLNEAIRSVRGRVWLITTNDNTRAIDFYQKRGFVIKEIHYGAVNESRKLKPAIPLTNGDGVAITDEIEMEMILR